MKLTQTVLNKLAASRELRLALMVSLGFKEQWIDKLIEKNKVNGPLTTVTALATLKEHTGLSDEEILEKELVEAQS